MVSPVLQVWRVGILGMNAKPANIALVLEVPLSSAADISMQIDMHVLLPKLLLLLLLLLVECRRIYCSTSTAAAHSLT